MNDGQLQKACIACTDKAAQLINEMKALHGALMFHQAGGCCDAGSPVCLQAGELQLGGWDMHYGDVCGVPYYISTEQYKFWKRTQMTIDVVASYGGQFSLESTTGLRFVARPSLKMNELFVPCADETYCETECCDTTCC